ADAVLGHPPSRHPADLRHAGTVRLCPGVHRSGAAKPVAAGRAPRKARLGHRHQQHDHAHRDHRRTAGGRRP
nr:hypothetical protein [Tanacetum cinerariifolium]